jgi:hypothetical protein
MENNRMIGGVIVLFLGLVFLLMNLGLLPYDFGRYWPIILVIVGAGILLQNDEKKKK